MPQIRNDAVRQFLDAFDADDAAFRDSLHPEIEWFPIEENRAGLAGIEAAMGNRQRWLDTWDEHELGVEEVVEDGDDVVVLVRLDGQGKASGAEVHVRFYAHFRVRDGKIAYIFDHEDRAEALEAAGLSPPPTG